MPPLLLSSIELSKSALLHNIATFRSLILPTTKITAVVKANAYGHGMKEIVQSINTRVDYFQIDDALEYALLKKYTSKPILILGYVAKQELKEILQDNNVTLAVYDTDQAKEINEIAQQLNIQVNIHLKIDALLGREGILLSHLKCVLDAIKLLPYLNITGVYAHFSNIEDTTDLSHAQAQIKHYTKAIQLLHSYGYTQLNTHMAATSGILTHPQLNSLFDTVRLGIGLYGLWPSQSLQASHPQIKLKPVLRWISHIAQIKTVPAQFPIGYGLTYVTARPTTIAVIPQGYSDGYDRNLSNVGEVLIHGERCKILGRISMNMCVADVTHLKNVQREDEVVLLGQQGNAEITAKNLANTLHTINYEIVSRISPLLPRVVIE